MPGPDGPIYPGTCRDKPKPAQMPDHTALRLDIRKALTQVSIPVLVHHELDGPARRTPVDALPERIGDVVLARRDFGASYHLSVVLDDADSGVTYVIRGQDLHDATLIHVLLQDLLGLPTPTYQHHKLIRDNMGKRLAKRDDARAIATYRAEGKSPNDIRALVGLDPV